MNERCSFLRCCLRFVQHPLTVDPLLWSRWNEICLRPVMAHNSGHYLQWKNLAVTRNAVSNELGALVDRSRRPPSAFRITACGFLVCFLFDLSLRNLIRTSCYARCCNANMHSKHIAGRSNLLFACAAINKFCYKLESLTQ